MIALYTPEIAQQITTGRAHMARHVPCGYELVYDIYNALVFGYGPSVKASQVVMSIAAYPQWVTLFFMHGTTLPDPDGLLEGSGNQIRGVRLRPFTRLDTPAVQALIKAAMAPAVDAFKAAPALSTVIRTIAPKQRPRRPKGSVD